ncbi:MAG: histidine phosphatase family protein [Thermomicrobiales bacterium]
MTVEIIYETHSITTDNEAGIATGWLPGKLSERGRELAHALGERRRTDDLAAVFVSDLPRAVETAELAFAGSEIPIFQDARLRECNYGALNGMPLAQLETERSRHVDEPFPGGQSYRQLVGETRDFLHTLAALWNGRTVLIIAHAANKWAFDHLLNGIPLENLIDAPFAWQAGWRYSLPAGWGGE